MAQEFLRNGRMELKFNEDRTQALLTVHPAEGGGASVDPVEVLERLNGMGVKYGIREQAILEAIHYADETKMAAVHVVVAQGVLPQDGVDARINYCLPLDVLTQPMPKRNDGSGQIDWFALPPEKRVKADQELAVIIPAQQGSAGKTLTWPIQVIAPKPGKPPQISAGANVRSLDGGLKLVAAQDGCVVLHGEQLRVHALKQMTEIVQGGEHVFSHGAVFLNSVLQAQITAEFVAIRGRAMRTRIRTSGDVYIIQADHCEIIAAGDVYVAEGLSHCNVITRKKLLLQPSSTLVGGVVYATEGISAGNVGSDDFTETELHVGVDRFSEVRIQEIQEELATCDANIRRISQALKPFVTVTAHAALPEAKRTLLQTLQAQQRSQELHIKELHNERRTLSIAAKEKHASTVTVVGTAYPGVWIGVGSAATQIESPLEQMRFVEGLGGKSVMGEPLQEAA